MKRTIICIAFFVSILGGAKAQDIKLVKATSQKWAGGVCCRYGTYFNFVIQTKINNITLDTVWINDAFYPLAFFKDALYGNTKKYDSLTKTTTFTIAVGENHDDAPRMNTDENTKTESAATSHVPKKKFNGAALFTYQYKGKQCSFVIKEFTVLKSLAYP